MAANEPLGPQESRAQRSITIRLGYEDPPIGVAIGEGGIEIAFAGWLGMLHAVSELFKGAAVERGRTQGV